MTYQEEQLSKYYERLNNILSELPDFCSQYFVGKQSKSIKTKVTYAVNLKTFFEYMSKVKPINTLQDLKTVTADDIVGFMNYLGNYKKDGKTISNGDAGKIINLIL
jgi:hypothetical protein